MWCCGLYTGDVMGSQVTVTPSESTTFLFLGPLTCVTGSSGIKIVLTRGWRNRNLEVWLLAKQRVEEAVNIEQHAAVLDLKEHVRYLVREV